MTGSPRQSPPSPHLANGADAASGQNLHPTKTVHINWQITWHTIPLLNEPMQQDHAIAVRRKVGIRLRLHSDGRLAISTEATRR
jgi:hypothetical protein